MIRVKEILKKILYCLFTTLCSLVAIYFLIQTIPYVANIYRDKDAVGKNIPLRDERQKFDVLLVGASHMGAILPAQLWNRHGISCYNSYSDGNGMRKTVSSLEMSLQYCKPELVIIECETWWLDPDFYDESGKGNYHHAFDTYPLFTPFSDALYGVDSAADIDWSKVNIINQFKPEKLEAVKEFVKDQEAIARADKEKDGEESQDGDKSGNEGNNDSAAKSDEEIQSEMDEIEKEMAVPFYTYHSRWQELTEADFEPEVDYYMGGRNRFQSNAFELPERIMNADYVVDDEEVSDIQYVEKAIKLCQDNDVQVLLVCLPYVQGEKVQGRHNKLYQICEQYGVEFINMMYERDLVNYSYDFRDAGHMNLSGGTKCGDFLAEYIKEHYGIKDRRGQAKYDEIWKENYALYKEGLHRDIEEVGNWAEAANYLGLDEFEGELYIANPAGEYEEYQDYEYLDDELEEEGEGSEDEDTGDAEGNPEDADVDSEDEDTGDAESDSEEADTEDSDEESADETSDEDDVSDNEDAEGNGAYEDLESGEADFEFCSNPGRLGLIQTIKKNGYKIYGIEKAVAGEEAYLLKITRNNGEIEVEEYIGDQIQDAGVSIPEDCDSWTCIRDAESKEVCLEKTFD